MFFETIRSEGLSHLSYIIGDGGTAAVIDPRRDCKVYVDIATRHGAQVTHIFETHRHEDFVVGSLELARRTKAKIFHGHALAFSYGDAVREGDKFVLGNLTLEIIETPGHTPESICITLTDRTFSGKPAAVFTGDTLFVGDVGRTDLYPTAREELAEKLYDSLHKKLLPLGDGVVFYPAHGEGSPCGKNIAARPFSTLGYERQFSPALTKDRKDFIQHKIWEEHHYPPYFWQVEKFNQGGIPLVAKLPEPEPESAENFAAAARGGMIILDVRSPESFAGAHIPDSLCIPLDKLSLMGGWFLPYDREIGLVVQQDGDAALARLYLMRMGFDNVTHYLAGGMAAWGAAGKSFTSIPTADTEDLRRLVAGQEEVFILDVRSRTECAEIPAPPSSQNIFIGNLRQQIGNLPRDRRIITMCSTGRRAIIAASILRQSKFDNVSAYLGSDKALKTLQLTGKSRKAA